MRSEDEIQTELDRVEDVLEDIDAPTKEMYERQGYLDGLRFALAEFHPETEETPSADKIKPILNALEEQYPDSTIRVEREANLPTIDNIVFRMFYDHDDADEWSRVVDEANELVETHDTGFATTVLVEHPDRREDTP